MQSSHAAHVAGALDRGALERLRARFRGALIGPADPGYDQARRIWNGMIDKHPALIARCTGAADVIAAIGFAREHDLLAAVRGGGHSFAGHSTCDGGIVIDLSSMRGVWVDPRARIARAQGGCLLGDLDHETQAFGLATPAGVVSHTGLAGLALGGGFGWLSGRYGWTADNVLAVDLVTADGRLIQAAEREHPELLWGIRGGGGNFGVVTEFTLRLHPVGPVLCGAAVHPLERAPEALAFYREFMEGAPDELTMFAGVMAPPPLPAVPAALHGRPALMHVFCWCGDLAHGERVVRPLLEAGTPAAAFAAPMPYALWQRATDAAAAAGVRYYCKGGNLEALSDTAIAAICDLGARAPNPQIRIEIGRHHGAAKRVPEQAMALPRREEYFANVVCAWRDPAEDAVNISYAREFHAAMQAFAVDAGTYVNYLLADEQDRVRAVYGEEKYARLAALKREYDPYNLFRLNANIAPAGR
jgi:FAD/FMN-containing dehydrogenase